MFVDIQARNHKDYFQVPVSKNTLHSSEEIVFSH